MQEVLKKLFADFTGVEAFSCVKLSGDASNRCYYRLSAGDFSLIGVIGTSIDENRAFLALADCFAQCGLNAPKVCAVSSDELCYLLQDLGDETLFTRLKSSREAGVFSSDNIADLCRVMELLPDVQYGIARCFDFSKCYPVEALDLRSVFWDLNYFKYCFLKGAGVEFDEKALESEFEKLAGLLLDENEQTFLYRDFQSRNIMWYNDEPYFIDFQGGRKGPVYYDVASFVGQVRAKYTGEAVEAMLHSYMKALSRYRAVDETEFLYKLDLFTLFRLLQNLGTYGFRGLYERKKAFVESIPAALQRLSGLLGKLNEFPVLEGIVDDAMALSRFSPRTETGLLLDVLSFSYKRGIPEDYSGNGGGFVFDCRAIHNPGRYEPYKKLTGLDEPVKKFLENESEITAFLQNACALVDGMVETYMARGFTHIQVCCGCTGGQHRSVYSAEYIARHVAEKYAVRVCVNHTMLNKKYVL